MSLFTDDIVVFEEEEEQQQPFNGLCSGKPG